MSDDNKVKIQSADPLKIKNITYLNGTLHAPSSDKVPQIVINKKSDSEWEITVYCKRDGSKTYAEDFNRLCGSPYHEYAPNGGGDGSSPDELNLLFGVKIEFEYGSGASAVSMSADEVYIGQGHYSATNNWWIGGRSTVDNTIRQGHTMRASNGTGNFRLSISGGTSNFKLAYQGQGPSPALSKWTSTLPGTTSLTGMSIPGTHDSCAVYRKAGIFDPCTITQTHTLRQQLEEGIRFLDIRCRHYYDKFTIHHGAVYQNMGFGNGVLAECLAFLDKNPDETIVMSIKEEYDPEGNTRTFEQTFMAYLDSYQCRDRWHLDRTEPTLSQVRGKIVLFRRFPADKPIGLEALPWLENQTFFVGNDKAYMIIQDQYKGLSVDAKLAVINNFLIGARTGDGKALFVNFCSASSCPTTNPQDYAAVINPMLVQYFQRNTKGRFGCVLMDYEQEDINQLIINTNK